MRGICSGLMVSALDSGWSSPDSSTGLGHYVVFLSKTLYSHSIPSSRGSIPSRGSSNTPSGLHDMIWTGISSGSVGQFAPSAALLTIVTYTVQNTFHYYCYKNTSSVQKYCYLSINHPVRNQEKAKHNNFPYWPEFIHFRLQERSTIGHCGHIKPVAFRQRWLTPRNTAWNKFSEKEFDC